MLQEVTIPIGRTGEKALSHVPAGSVYAPYYLRQRLHGQTDSCGAARQAEVILPQSAKFLHFSAGFQKLFVTNIKILSVPASVYPVTNAALSVTNGILLWNNCFSLANYRQAGFPCISHAIPLRLEDCLPTTSHRRRAERVCKSLIVFQNIQNNCPVRRRAATQ